MDEEGELSKAYRTTRRVRRPEGQGLNDLYVRFFRMAERRIAERTGQGVVCFISNYSWLDSLSCPGMRERYHGCLSTVIRIDNLQRRPQSSQNTLLMAPDKSPDPSIFAIRGRRSRWASKSALQSQLLCEIRHRAEMRPVEGTSGTGTFGIMLGSEDRLDGADWKQR